MEVNLYENCLTANDFNLLRESVGWSELPKLQIEQSLKKGIYSVVAKHNEKIVAMGRLVGDESMYWYIQDVIVIPEYQGKNIGKRIIESLLKYIQIHSLPETTTTVGLMVDKDKEEFYEKIGFIKRPNETLVVGMIKKIIVN